jgi:hypothetical protein
MNAKTNKYGADFYKMVNETAYNSASVVLPIMLNILPEINSAIDFGCGTGTWLHVLNQCGVKNVRGLDGSWVNKDALKINKTDFTEINFEKKISPDRKYDLAISLEVAEHISESMAVQFVESLTCAADFVLFSAAIPYQSGTNHINEQWPDYWYNIFESQDYIAVDYLRGKIWNSPEVSVWYKQNILLYVKNERKGCIRRVPESCFCSNVPPSALVHPDLYLNVVKNEISQLSFWQISKKLIRRGIKNLLAPLRK